MNAASIVKQSWIRLSELENKTNEELQHEIDRPAHGCWCHSGFDFDKWMSMCIMDKKGKEG